jgi:hypothetical protein
MTQTTLLVAVAAITASIADYASDLAGVRNVCQLPSAATRGQEVSS